MATSFYDDMNQENTHTEKDYSEGQTNHAQPQPTIFSEQPSSKQPSKKEHKHRTLVLGMAAMSLSSALMGGTVAGYFMRQPSNGATVRTSIVAQQQAPSSAQEGMSKGIYTPASNTSNKPVLTVSQINGKVGPAVVSIVTEIQSDARFNRQMMPQTQQASGSGVIISSDGTIMTNNHVVEGASNIKVYLLDGKTYDAKLVGNDERTDLAVIKIEATNLPYAVLGDSDKLEVGELAVAIGDPLGELKGSVTSGIISALDREVTIDNKKLELIQTDAAINPGNSGGALVNQYGEVIGINTAKTSAVGVEGLGFAIPINDAKPIIEQLVQTGYVTGRPEIGISLQDVDAQTASYYNVAPGVYVQEVKKNSAAERGDIQKGDRIVSINDKAISAFADISSIMDTLKAGDSVSIEVERDGKMVKKLVTLTESKPA